LATDRVEITKHVDLYTLVSRMRVLSDPSVVQHADVVVKLIAETYGQPKMTLRELHDVILSGQIDTLREFAEACREDLGRLRSI